MDTDRPFHGQLHTLGIYLITVTEAQSPQFLVDDDRWRRIILDGCKIIEQVIPEAVRNELYRLASEMQAEFRKAPHQQISPDVSRSPVTTSAPILQGCSLNRPGKKHLETDPHDRALQVSKQIPIAIRKSPKSQSFTRKKYFRGDYEQPIPLDTLKSWAASPETLLNSAAISIRDLGVSDYIQALDKSSQTTKIARRFALVQLWVSREVWWPWRLDAFKRRLGKVPKGTFDRWLREGRTLFLLKAHSGAAVLFSKLKPQNDLVDMAPRWKPRPEDNTNAGFDGKYQNLEPILQSHYAKETRELASRFNVEELEIPMSRDNDITYSKLYRDAARSISLCLGKLHEKLLFSDMSQPTHDPEAPQDEPVAKRICRSSGPLMDCPSNLRVSQHQFSHDTTRNVHNGNQRLPCVTESTTAAIGDSSYEVRCASSDERMPMSSSLEGASSQSVTFVMPGSDSYAIATPPLKAAVGRYKTKPSTDRTTPVESIGADMGPFQVHKSTVCRNTNTDQLSEGHLDRPCADRAEELHDCRGNISQTSGLYFEPYEAPSQILGIHAAFALNRLGCYSTIPVDDDPYFNFETNSFMPLDVTFNNC
ncbi:uncharacterized protein BKA55DRAFT_698152 [Fusarium redolens]|uniref:Uncharacterized protein n=1 Tax=Fusarium redolens TaxID=48865 RepID=A0A9P9FX34_FUSRE|nr:uncharacterized protein BKA55DRAFT_698152 [Fusarium redolens]KAH7208429.1 hypothetical protein BKA55DRAFT_698152 [Fusarium redolens]